MGLAIRLLFEQMKFASKSSIMKILYENPENVGTFALKI
jgi:hypothetical protein